MNDPRPEGERARRLGPVVFTFGACSLGSLRGLVHPLTEIEGCDPVSGQRRTV